MRPCSEVATQEAAVSVWPEDEQRSAELGQAAAAEDNRSTFFVERFDSIRFDSRRDETEQDEPKRRIPELTGRFGVWGKKSLDHRKHQASCSTRYLPPVVQQRLIREIENPREPGQTVLPKPLFLASSTHIHSA